MIKKAEFVQKIKDTEYCAEMSKKDIEAVLKGVNDAITEIVASEESVKLEGIGTFSGITRPAREARNPASGKTIQVPEKHGYPHFKFSSTMKKCD